MSGVSIVISSYNEQYLDNTINTILDKDNYLLSEIIIVDDCSHEKVKRNDCKVIRNNHRCGLIRSRNIGVAAASGDIVIILDAHIKVGDNWLRPIIDHLKFNRCDIVIPATQQLSVIDWTPYGVTAYKNAFDWSLNMFWYPDDGTDISPALAGHCFAFNKSWFEYLDGFDNGLWPWGGENIEISIKTWLCGGRIYITRNSSVAHLFRRKFPYKVSKIDVLRNKSRIANTLFYDNISLFYDNLGTVVDPGDISDRIGIRKKFKYDIDWYINNIARHLKLINFKNVHNNEKAIIVTSKNYNYDKNKIIIGAGYADDRCNYAVLNDYSELNVFYDFYQHNSIFSPVVPANSTGCIPSDINFYISPFNNSIDAARYLANYMGINNIEVH